MFDSRQYEWADITLNIGGKDIIGFTGIRYGSKQDKELLHGKGSEPYAIQRGNKTYDGELTMWQSTYETLRINSSDKSVLSLQLDAVVLYGNPSRGDMITTDILQGIQFTEEAKEFAQGDKKTEIKLPFIYLRQK